MRLITSLLLVLCIMGCSKDDDSSPSGGGGPAPVNPSAPVLTVLGNNPYYLQLRDIYNDPGATAMDQEEGDLTSDIVVTNNVNTYLPGTYQFKYFVMDSTSLVDSASRNIIVYATSPSMSAMYSVTDSLFYNGGNFVDYYSLAVFPTTSQNRDTLRFNQFADYSGNNNIYALIDSAGHITLPLQTGLNIGSASEDHQFQGTGYVTNTGFFLEYTDKNISLTPPATVNCKAYCVR